jgi:hypothetical protein
MVTTRYIEMWNNAALLRRYVLRRYGDQLRHGLPGIERDRLDRTIHRLCVLTKLPKKVLVAELKLEAK